MRIGLAGGYCSGKSEAARMLAARGWTCIDADSLGHEALEALAPLIERRFGPGLLDESGGLGRGRLAAIVFSDPRALAELEALVHPEVDRMIAERVAQAQARSLAGELPRICVHAALLHRSRYLESCDALIEVQAGILARLRRGLKRDGLGIAAVLKRLWSQRGFSRRLAGAARSGGIPLLKLRNEGGRAELDLALSLVLDAIAALPPR